MNELKTMTDDTLTAFQASGTLTVCGHQLTTDDVSLKYAFDIDAKDTMHHYEAHSNGDVSKGLFTLCDMSATSLVISLWLIEVKECPFKNTSTLQLKWDWDHS